MNSVVDPTLAIYLRNNPLEKRKCIVKNIKNLYPDRVPILVGRGELKITPPIEIFKFLSPSDITFRIFSGEVRQHIKNIESHVALMFFVNNTIPVHSMTTQQAYDRYKSEDGFLYVTYVCENTFG